MINNKYDEELGKRSTLTLRLTTALLVSVSAASDNPHQDVDLYIVPCNTTDSYQQWKIVADSKEAGGSMIVSIQSGLTGVYSRSIARAVDRNLATPGHIPLWPEQAAHVPWRGC